MNDSKCLPLFPSSFLDFQAVPDLFLHDNCLVLFGLLMFSLFDPSQQGVAENLFPYYCKIHDDDNANFAKKLHL